MRVIRNLALTGAAALLAASTAVAVQQRSVSECEAAGNSPHSEPAWYAEACGYLHRVPMRHVAPHASPFTTGDPAFHVNLRSTPDQFQTFLLPNANAATTLGTITAGINLYGLEHDNASGVLYAVDDAAKTFGTVNKANGTYTPSVTITGLGAGYTVTGLAFQSIAGPVYLSAGDATATSLYTLNTATGVATAVGPMGVVLMIDIAINNAGQMYGYSVSTDSLYSINTATGAATLIGALGYNVNFAQSCDFDKSTGVLYAWLYIGTGVNYFVTIDTATGAATLVNTPTNIEPEGALTPVELQGFDVE